MKITRAELMAVAVSPSQYPGQGPAEIAFAGRSNVGKSSLLNLLTGRRNLARTSGNPGKTRTINFFTINNDSFRIVDLPGYGYAQVSKSESKKWGPMIEEYLMNRDSLRCVFLLVDIRHDPSQMDVQMYEYLRYNNLDGPIVATKSDKISRSSLPKQIKRIREVLGAPEDSEVIPVSSLKRTGVGELVEAIERNI